MKSRSGRSPGLWPALAVALSSWGGCVDDARLAECERVEAHFESCSLPVRIGCEAATEDEYERVLAMSCDELGALMGSTPASTARADFVGQSAPDNWQGYNGTAQYDVDWLYTWTTYAGSLFDEMVGGFGVLVGGDLGYDVIDDMAARVRTEVPEWDCPGRVARAGELVGVELSARGEYYCRSYAVELRRVLGRLDIEANLEGATVFEGLRPTGHAWIEASCASEEVVADAYNVIYIRVR